ncbi:MAG: hypothetical protein JWO06_102 [Bacteroidota bacterium]|nr:hypothetical protein [Bacteroidota bacterium]
MKGIFLLLAISVFSFLSYPGFAQQQMVGNYWSKGHMGRFALKADSTFSYNYAICLISQGASGIYRVNEDTVFVTRTAYYPQYDWIVKEPYIFKDGIYVANHKTVVDSLPDGTIDHFPEQMYYHDGRLYGVKCKSFPAYKEKYVLFQKPGYKNPSDLKLEMDGLSYDMYTAFFLMGN